ncbi:SDR family oxidoreductase [Amycolatopsis rhabdoformis]|uniref:SDR family oxidoreductase n=1 Tax=Amycolatopsis rhabdoformis TaxID=1448059 RepID=A0ABZ1HYJ3_9PSEU|nr:SDR family oxidoreductase [Amycolatopsis rhabdoformis]WSE26691.1 SDR family oxidoreductase [Amycolatopsis rhabdoformis]
MNLSGKVALVTGSSKGLGRAIVLRLAEQGADVVINYSRDAAAAEEVQKAAEAHGVKALVHAADVSQVDGIVDLYDAAIAAFGKVDIVVANAGMEKVNIPVTDVTEEDFDLLFRVNTKGPYFVLREAARRIADGGRIITISSNTTTVPQLGVGLYGTSKVATGYLVKVLAMELGPRRVTVNTVVPGPIDGAGIFTDPANDEYKRSLIEMVPIGRLGTTEDVAGVTAFLAGDDAGLITGQQLVCDGGMH